MNKTIAELVFISLLFIGCGGNKTNDNEELVKGGALVVDFSATKVKSDLLAKGAIDENKTVFGYKAYKIPYVTQDEDGYDVNVSGLLVIPTGLPKEVKGLGLSMVCDDHGTVFSYDRVPTTQAVKFGTPNGSAIILTSLAGFATLKPDYIGFGDSKAREHPYVMKNSLANATVDFIRTVKKFAKNNNIKLNNQLFLTGYSEGGYASLATLKKIEEEQLTDLKVTMAVPMAGSYELVITADSVLNRESWGFMPLAANLAFAHANQEKEALNTVFNKPYDSSLSELLDGSLDFFGLMSKLPTKTKGEKGLFLESFVSEYFDNNDSWFKEAMQKNSIHNWAPTTPVRLVHCEGDDIIPYKVAVITESTMQTLGAIDVKLLPLEKTLGLSKEIAHIPCGALSYGLATKIFSDIRKKTIGY